MAFDWIAGLFQSEQTRGLSGDSASAVALDDANPYYNFRLRRHRTDDDLVDEPALLWHTSRFVTERGGLGAHIAAERGDGVANFTDVLIVLSEEDYDRARGFGVDAWTERARAAILAEFESFCRREQFARLYDGRPLQLRFICEGSDAMGGQLLGLAPGEFITGLLPNLYTGPVDGSRPIIGVHVNLPGVWEGYREVGRLHSDQVLFTLGNHWLDNFSHPTLQQAALYRLQQYPDGSFVHIVNPDLADRYQVTSVEQGGTNVLTLATRDGQPLAYMVLALIDAPEPAAPEPATPPTRARPGIAMPVAPASEATPDMAPPMLIDDALQPVSSPGPATQPRSRQGSKTIIPDAPSQRILTLQERGALLQKVHFSAFMEGYDVYISRRGELATIVDDPAAVFQVRRREVSLRAHVDLLVGGRRLAAGEVHVIEGDVSIELGKERMEYRDLRGLDVEGWPYVGEIRRPTSSSYLVWGEEHRIGRSRECRVVLPDEPRNDNIHWKASVGDGATIRARNGEIPKSRFYTDSIMVGSEHATLDLRQDLPEVICNARHCFVYVRRRNEVTPLFPSTSGRSPQKLAVEPGDELLIGNCLFQVGYSEVDERFAAPAAPAPEVRLSPDSLVDAVSEPDLGELGWVARDVAARPAPAPPPAPKPAPEPPAMAPPQLVDDDDAPEPLRPLSQATPMAAVGMESVLGGQLRAVSDADLLDDRDAGVAAELPPLEDVGDDPTTPGLAVPQGLFDDEDEDGADLDAEDALFDQHEGLDDDGPIDAPTPAAARFDAPPSPDDDPDEITGPPVVPQRPVGADSVDEVPDPFPDVEAPVAPPRHEPYAAGDDDDDDDDAIQTVVEGVPAPLPPTEDDQPTEMVSAQAVQAADQATAHVIATADDEARFELARPLHIVLAGWTVRGEVVAGNHSGADLVIPENRIVDGQVFVPTDYFRLSIRGRRGQLEVLAPTEVLIDERDPEQRTYDSLADRTIDVVRRDDRGDEDFVVRFIITEDRSLPDPRARFVALDYEDPLAAALVTRGLGVEQPRELTLGGVSMTLTYDGERVRVSDYLATYRRAEGFAPFFVQRDGQRFVTAPETGEPFELGVGDRFVVGDAIYLVKGL